MLRAVSSGERPECLRLHRPSDVLAFSVLDRTRAGFDRAVAAAREIGFDPILRLAGGRAAVFHVETLAFAWSVPSAEPRRGIHERFAEMAELVVGALRHLGVDARVGEVPGEYCPGAYSVNAGGKRKLMGVGQRVSRGAAHVGGVIVVRDAPRVREALHPVYEALGFDFEPESVGSVEDEIGAIGVDDVADALLDAFGERYDLEPDTLDEATLAAAESLEAEHRLEAPSP